MNSDFFIGVLWGIALVITMPRVIKAMRLQFGRDYTFRAAASPGFEGDPEIREIVQHFNSHEHTVRVPWRAKPGTVHSFMEGIEFYVLDSNT